MLTRFIFGSFPRSSRLCSPFLKDEKRGKRIFLRGGFPYSHENKKGTKRLTLKRNANVASLPLLFLMRKARTHKTKGFRLARIYPSFGACPHSVSYPRGEVSDAKHCVLHKPPFAFTPSQAQSAKRCASERGFLLFLLSRAEGKLPSIKDFLFPFLVSFQEMGAPRVVEKRSPRGLSGKKRPTRSGIKNESLRGFMRIRRK